MCLLVRAWILVLTLLPVSSFSLSDPVPSLLSHGILHEHNDCKSILHAKFDVKTVLNEKIPVNEWKKEIRHVKVGRDIVYSIKS